MTPRGVDFDPQDPLIRALRALPDARAPRTLAPRVMAAVQARLARPSPRTWFDWPLAWRVVSIVGAVSALIAAVLVWPQVVSWAQPAVEAVSARALDVADGVVVSLNVAGVLFHAVWYPIVQPFLIFVTAMTIACATLGALVSRVALGGAPR